jgi:hypothetical protein
MCATDPDIENIKAAVELGQKRVDQALKVGYFLQKESAVFDKLTKANEGMGKIGETLENIQNVCVNIDFIAQIADAVKVLSDDNVIYSDPEKAADAFDVLFQGFGKLCSHLPFPANQWAKFFDGFNLFGNMQRKVYRPYFDRLNSARDQTGEYATN